MITSVSQKFPIYGKWVPNKLKTIFTTVFIFSILYFFSQLILSSFNSIIDSHHNYNDNINGLINLINDKFKIDLKSYICHKIYSHDINKIYFWN